MNDGQREQLQKIKKAMKIHEIVSTDKSDLIACKNDLMKKFSMDENEANEIALSIRDLFLPKLLDQEQISPSELPEDCLNCQMTDTDDDFANADPIENHEEDHEADSFTDSSEVDDNEIATIHITVPKYKVREVQEALNTIIGDDDADSMDQATNDHNNGEDDMEQKEIEARKALRKTILAAVADDDETKSLPRNDKANFDYNTNGQYKEEDFYNTTKGDMTDPDFDTLKYNKNKIPNWSKVVEHIKPDLGLHESLEATHLDGAPDDAEEYTIEFDDFKFPTQGDDNLFNEFSFPSEGKVPHKRTLLSSSKPTELEENLLADALRLAGVEDNDLKELTYAEAQQLYKAIKTASEAKERTSYSPDGKLPANFNTELNKTMKQHIEGKEDRKSVTEEMLDEDHSGNDNEVKDHKRSGRELYSSQEDERDVYAQMLRKLMNPKLAQQEEEMDDWRGESDKDKTPKELKEKEMGKEAKEINMPLDVDVSTKESVSDYKKEAELYKARLKTAYAMSNKLVVAELLPAEELDAYAEGMLNDGLTVTAMVRQTKLLLQSAAANAERLASYSKGGNVRTASSSGIAFNPSIRGASSNVTSDLSGALDIQQALKNIGWTTKVNSEMED